MQLTKEHFLKIYGDYLEPNTDINQKNVVFKCPFHADSNPSYAVSTDPTHPVGHCWSCNAKHSWVNFYMTTRGIDYITALKQLDMFDNDYKPAPQPPKFVTTHPEQLVPKAKKQHIEVDYSEISKVMQKQNCVKHNLSATRIYHIWNGIKTRCNNKNKKEAIMYDFMDYLESMKDYEDALQLGFDTVEEYYEYISVTRKQMEG